MAVRTLTEDLDNLYTTTWQHRKGQSADQIFDAVPFYYWMKDKGRMDKVVGGTRLTESLRYAKSDNVRWITKGTAMPLTDKEFMTVSTYNWAYIADSIVRFGIDDQQNSGKAKIIDLMNSKLDNSKDTLIDTLEAALFSSSTSAANQMHGLLDVVADDPTASSTVFGGIDQSTYTWWRNKTQTMTGSSFTTNGRAQMITMLNNCSNNMRQDTPDLILSGQTPYELYERIAAGIQQITNKELADIGFTHQMFKGIPMLWSPQCSNQRMYFLNTRFLRIKYDPRMWFDMTEWKAIPDQVNDRAAQVVSALQLVSSRRRVHGVLHTIDTV